MPQPETVEDNIYPLEDYYCPKCGWGPVEEGEIRDRDTAYRWQYCRECGWQGHITRYRIVPWEYGTAYRIDARMVRPDVALSREVRGKLRLTAECPNNALASDYSASQPQPSAPCPQCAAVLKHQYELCEDFSGYYVFWSCDVCGFRSDAIKNPAPGIFTHSEGYRNISWRGRTYELTKNQALIVKKLHAQYRANAPDVHQKELLKEMDVPGSRVRDSFRSANRELWSTLIVHFPGAPRGTYRIRL